MTAERLRPSWRDGATRSAVAEFLGSVDQVPPAERVAVFDNDGTLICGCADESEAGTFASSESILDTAARFGWTVVSVKDDWSTVFASS